MGLDDIETLNQMFYHLQGNIKWTTLSIFKLALRKCAGHHKGIDRKQCNNDNEGASKSFKL